MAKLLYIVTVPNTAKALLSGQLDAMCKAGFDVSVVASPGPELQVVARQQKVQVYETPMQREISPREDLISLWKLIRLLRQVKPDIVNASTPKAGLLGMLAAWLTRVPVRIYLLRGLRMETTSGLKRMILRISERIASGCASQIVCTSQSLKEVYAAEGLAPPDKLTILGYGSSNGIDPKRFLSSDALQKRAIDLRKELCIPFDAPVIGFVGRFTRDKGIAELIDSFAQLQRVIPNVHLLLLGRFEEGDPISAATVERIELDPRIIRAGFVADTAPYYHIFNIFAFPSYREGFPNSPLEAAVAGIPTVGFRTTGVVDAVKDGETGILTTPGDVRTFTEAMQRLLEEPELRRQLGENAQRWALANFNRVDVWHRWAEFYGNVLNNNVSSHTQTLK